MTNIKFTKMHGLGNDFVVINTIEIPISIEHLPIKQLSDRHVGIGFDQLLLIGRSTKADYSCRIFNADGNEAEQCGNGMRCVARFLHEENLCQMPSMSIETKAGVVEAVIQDYQHIRIKMGVPEFNEQIPELGLPILAILSMGNPHAILHVPSIEKFPITEIGAKLSTHAVFPQGINVGFMEIINSKHIKLRTYERGSGETFACGSNACAAVAAGVAHHLLISPVQVDLPLGSLQIAWANSKAPIYMTGTAEKVFDGNLYLKLI